MPSTYTTNLGIEKIATGEQSGTWGTTTNTNFDLIDTAVNGIVSVTLASAGTSGSPNDLPITDGTASNGRNKFIEFVDGGDLGATAYVQLTPNNAEKIVHIRNSLSGSRSIIVFQGTYNASNDFEIPNGADVTLKFNGGGTGATVTDVNVDLTVTGVTATSTASFSGATIDDLGTVTTADINGGTIDGTVIGGSSAAAGTFTTANATTVDATNIEVTNIKAKDGTAAGSIADSTGVVTLASSVLTTADINGGTADAVVIGGSTAAAGTFTTFTSTGIDDNATSTAITIDSSENVNIGAVGTTTLTTLTGPFNGDVVKMDGSSGVSDRHLIFSNSSNSQQWDIDAEGGASSLGVLSFSTNSTERMRIDSSGKVGIGTASPAVEVEVASAAPQIRLTDTDGGYCEVTNVSGNLLLQADKGNTEASSFMRFDVDNTERMRIDSSGNVGIGTSSPSATLDVKGSARIERDGSSALLQFTDTGVNSRWMGLVDGTSRFAIYGTNGSTEELVIDSSGNVGIGTASPSRELEIKLADDTTTTLGQKGGISLYAPSNTAGNGGEITWASAVNGEVWAAISGHITSNGTGVASGALVFGTGNSSALPTERMRIDSSGNVGIGTSSPSYTLDIQAVPSSFNPVRFSGYGSSIDAFLYTDTAYWSIGDTAAYGGNLWGGNKTSNFVHAHTNGAERMRIDSNGQVGIGATTSMTNISGYAFVVTNDTSGGGLTCQTSGSDRFAVYNASDDGYYDVVASHVWRTGGVFGGTERVRIDSSGNLLVGTTSPVGGSSVAGVTITEVSNIGQISIGKTYSGSTAAVKFYFGTTQVGRIDYSDTATTYVTTSDQRLKENIVDAPAGNIDAIRVRSFDWKADGTHQPYGMIAQELVEVAPEAVSQGETEEDHWGVDYSKLVPMMIKEIQDLKAEVAALKGA